MSRPLRSIRLTISRGDLATSTADTLITSANDSLVGNKSPTYWRFISRVNADGALRKLAGPELEKICLRIEPIDSSRLRRDITRWTSGVKIGESSMVRCAAGSAVRTPATGRLQADHIVHAVAPDSEFGFEGIYTGGRQDQEVSGAVDGSDSVERFTSQQFTPPDGLLLSAYEQALRMSAAESRSVACPALGSGVKGWKPAISCALGLEAAARLLAPRHEAPPSLRTDPRTLSLRFVLGGYGPMAETSWRDWVRVAPLLLGPPEGYEAHAATASELRKADELHWDLSPELIGTLAPQRSELEADGDEEELAMPTALALERVAEMREMWMFRKQGYSGKDEPLTPEQELAATRRRTSR